MTKHLAAWAALALLLISPAGSPTWAKDQLSIGISQFAANFHPGIDAMVAKAYIQGATYQRINLFNADWRLECQLCVETPTLENGRARIITLPDGKRGMEIRIDIRPDARWGDGRPVTARDVLFGIKVGQTKDVGYSEIRGYERIRAARAQDDKTVVMTIEGVEYTYNWFYGLFALPAHVEEPIFDSLAGKADYGKNSLYNRAPTTPGLWNGPYLVAEYVAGFHVTLAPNPHWGGPRPAFRRVHIRTIENTAALQANLLSGEIDMIAGEIGLTLDQGLEMAKDRRVTDRFSVIFQPGLIYEHIDLNLDNPLLKDRRVRQALLLGIDREGLTRQLFEERQPVAHSNIHPRDVQFDPKVRRYPFDPRQAARLLDEAGFSRRAADGVRLNAQGQRLSLDFQTTAGNRTRELVQQALLSQWRELGIETLVKNEPARLFFGETMRQRRFTGLAMYAWISAPESTPRTQMHSQNIPTAANNWAGQNYPGYFNADMDRLIESIEGELDANRRKALWAIYQNLYANELPVLPLFFRADVFVLPRPLQGVRPTGNQFPSTHWIPGWRWSAP